jgi:hypothetical protein
MFPSKPVLLSREKDTGYQRLGRVWGGRDRKISGYGTEGRSDRTNNF